MSDPVVARLRAEIDARGAEIARAREPGFVPDHRDARGVPETLPDANPLRAVAPGEARFVVVGPSGRHAYTRDGDLRERDGRIVDAHGAAVLGYAEGATTLAPLRIPKHDRALGRVEHLRLERDGRLVYERAAFDPRDGALRRERVCAGTVALARFPAGTEPVRERGLERAPTGVEPLLGRPDDGAFGPLRTGRAEFGALDLNAALARLHDVYQQLDAVAAAQRAGRDTTKVAMDLVK